MAEKIRINIESLNVQYGTPAVISNLTVSIGIASLKYDQLNAIDLLELADKALYVAKNSGRNNCQILNTI